MKKLFLIFTIFFSTLWGMNAQSRVGHSVANIKTAFSAPSYQLLDGTTDDGQYYIYINTTHAVVFYYFNNYNKCDMSVIVPKTQGDLNYYVEKYNSQYVIRDKKNWTAYLEGGVNNIKLVYLDNGGYAFYWTAAD